MYYLYIHVFTKSCETALGRSSRLLGTVLGSRGSSIRHTSKIVKSTHTLVLDTGKILGSSTSNRHNTMLLRVVSLTGDVSSDDLSIRQADSACLSVGRVRLLGLENHDTQHDTALERVAGEIRRLGALGLLALEQRFELPAARNLVDGRVPHLLLLGVCQYPAYSRGSRQLGRL